jgi:hypothetical protein
MTDLANIGATMIALAVVILVAYMSYLMILSTIKSYEKRNLRELITIGIIWWVILGFAFLMIGSL